MRSLRALSGVPARGAMAGSLASGLLGQLLLLATGILVARTLGPTDRGYLALLVLLPAVLQHVGTLGLPLATTYFIARNVADEPAVRRNIALPAVAQAIVLVLLQGVVLFFLLEGEPDRVRMAGLVSLALLPGALADMYGKALLQGQRRYAVFNVLRNATIVFYLVGIGVLWTLGIADLDGFAAAWVVANLLSGALTLAVALYARPRRSPESTGVSRRRMLKFGIVGLLGSLSPVATFRLDQAVVGLFLSPEALGLYVAGLAFTNLPAVISRGVAMIALPQVAGSSRNERQTDVWRFVVVSTALTGVVVVVLELTAGVLVPLFFGTDFEDAVGITRILLVAAFFNGVRRVLTDSVSGSGRPGLGSVAELVSWVVLVPALVVLTPVWEASGVATALAIASAVSLGALILIFRRPPVGETRPEQAVAVPAAEDVTT
jgi:O-antigen/teichoic acid export membrane protein